MLREVELTLQGVQNAQWEYSVNRRDGIRGYLSLLPPFLGYPCYLSSVWVLVLLSWWNTLITGSFLVGIKKEVSLKHPLYTSPSPSLVNVEIQGYEAWQEVWHQLCSCKRQSQFFLLHNLGTCALVIKQCTRQRMIALSATLLHWHQREMWPIESKKSSNIQESIKVIKADSLILLCTYFWKNSYVSKHSA